VDEESEDSDANRFAALVEWFENAGWQSEPMAIQTQKLEQLIIVATRLKQSIRSTLKQGS
jgi:hypothetical protein